VIVAGIAAASLFDAMFAAQRALATGPRRTGLALAAYVLATAGLFAIQVSVVRACRRRAIGTTHARRMTLALPLVFYAVALIAPPTLSIDVASYVAHGSVRVDLDENPYLTPASAGAGTPLGSELARYGWRPVHPVSPYGPLWTDIEVATVSAVGGTAARVLVLKCIASAASLGVAALIWFVLGGRRPEERLVGTVAYLWNPMIVGEIAGDGHNDALMALLVLAALALTLRRPIVAGVASTAAALTKYVPLLFLPAQAVYVWRAERETGRRRRIAAVSGSIGAALVIVTFAPYWVGARTFHGLSESAAASGTAATTTIVGEAVSRLPGLPNAGPALHVIAFAAMLAVVAMAAASVRTGPGLFRATAWIAFAFLLASPTYWPWYAVLPVALAAVVPDRPFPVLLLAASIGARLAAPLDVLYVDGAIDRSVYLVGAWVTGLGLPAVAIIRHAVRRRVRAE
jgi:putative effector of murein hydrolase LrgA (UPF0299 family)